MNIWQDTVVWTGTIKETQYRIVRLGNTDDCIIEVYNEFYSRWYGENMIHSRNEIELVYKTAFIETRKELHSVIEKHAPKII